MVVETGNGDFPNIATDILGVSDCRPIPATSRDTQLAGANGAIAAVRWSLVASIDSVPT